MHTSHTGRRAVSMVFTLCLAVGLLWPAGATARKKKTRVERRTEVEQDIDNGMPPDAPLAPLEPQEPISFDVIAAHQREHYVGASHNMGIDVSHYQGSINWTQVARSGEVSYVYVKATEGSSLVDNTYRTNLTGARRAGLKVGVYHFFSPRVPVPEQVQNFTRNVNLREMDLVPIIDVEHIKGVTKEQLCSRLKKFLEQVERHYGVRPILYTFARFYNNYLSQHFSNYRFMIARYHTDVPELVNDVQFVMWQFTSEGHIAGIRGNVDRSRFMDNYDLQDILLRH